MDRAAVVWDDECMECAEESCIRWASTWTKLNTVEQLCATAMSGWQRVLFPNYIGQSRSLLLRWMMATRTSVSVKHRSGVCVCLSRIKIPDTQTKRSKRPRPTQYWFRYFHRRVSTRVSQHTRYFAVSSYRPTYFVSNLF